MQGMSSKVFSKYNILVVDDVPLNQMLVQKMLAHYNFRVRIAGNGLECLREIMAEKPSLILLDIMMPIMDGFQVLETLNESPELSKIPVVVLSALNSNEDIVKAYNLGAKDFITKPIVMNKLVNSVATQLGIPIGE